MVNIDILQVIHVENQRIQTQDNSRVEEPSNSSIPIENENVTKTNIQIGTPNSLDEDLSSS